MYLQMMRHLTLDPVRPCLFTVDLCVCPQAIQESENDKAEIVIVCEPEGMSLQMGGLHPRASLYEKPVNLEAAKQVPASAKYCCFADCCCWGCFANRCCFGAPPAAGVDQLPPCVSSVSSREMAGCCFVCAGRWHQPALVTLVLGSVDAASLLG